LDSEVFQPGHQLLFGFNSDDTAVDEVVASWSFASNKDLANEHWIILS